MVKSYNLALSFIALLSVIGCGNNSNQSPTFMRPPIALKKTKVHEIHGDKRQDPYFWMNDRENSEVIDYLNEENAYRAFVMKETDPFQEKLFQELKGRIKEEDLSVPYLLDGYYYYSRFEKGSEHPIFCRKKGSLNAPEEIVLNVNPLAKEHSYYQVGSLSVRTDKTMIAFGEDTVSRRIYTIRFKNLVTKEILDEFIPNTTGSFTWANDNKTGFYCVKDEALRSYKIFRHILGSSYKEDVEIYHEKDETYSTFVYKTKSKKYIIIGSGSTVADEYRTFSADNPMSEPVIFSPRKRGLEYQIAHFQDEWFIRTNKDEATNFKLMRCKETATHSDSWTDLIAHRTDVLLEDFQIFSKYLVVDERSNGLTRIRIMPWDGEEHYIEFQEETYTASIGMNPEFNTDQLRYSYSSLIQPNSVVEYNINSRERTILKEQEVVGGYNKEEYATERIWAPSHDGVLVPISLVYRKSSFTKDGSNPLLLYGYGSYGATIDAQFSSTRLSLLDRGFVFAIAHIRGGQYLGRQWYEDGKLLHKQNTFSDFISAAKHLQKEQYTSRDRCFGEGGSAGGLLIGAVVNQSPELFKGVIAAVPFVDVMTTMLDESIPLTTMEYDEWGNPNDKEYYDYMLQYSPYDNVKAQFYPAMLVTTGLYDSQVQYWEPAKWVARLRDMKKDNNPLLLHCNMSTGHSGASGRFESLKEMAMEYAFLFDLMGIKE